MSGAFITSEFEGLRPVLDRMNALANPRLAGEGLAQLGGLVENQTTARFDERRSPEDEAWAAWSPGYAKDRKKGQSLLVASGGYRDSFAWDLTGDSLRVGSPMIFAALHQFGGTDDMAPGPAAVPARPVLGVSPENAVEIEEAMAGWIESVLQ